MKWLLAVPVTFALVAGLCGLPVDCPHPNDPTCNRPPVVEPSLPPSADPGTP